MGGLDLVHLHLDDCRFNQAEAAHVALAGPNRRIAALARFGQRLLRLDLEDIDLGDRPELRRELPASLLAAAQPLAFPRQPHDLRRGPLGSAVPLYRLMLEVIEIRWRRRESLHVLALLHLLAEYAGHLAWEGVLGHAGDPRDLGAATSGRASRWGDLDDDLCGHSMSQRHLAIDLADQSVMRSPEAWQEFLREDYSRVGEMLSVCGVRGSMRAFGKRARACDAECSVWARIHPDDRATLEARCRLAALFGRSPIVQLRHSSPIGHFFGVPSRDELADAWWEMAGKVKRQLDIDLVDDKSAARVDAMPANIASLCCHLAGEPMTPLGLVGRVVEEFRSAITR